MSMHDEALRLDAVRRWLVPVDGTLAVRRARVWITRDGDPADHVLAPGDTLALQAGDRLTLEPWHADAPVLLQWRAVPQPLAAPLRLALALLARGADRLGTLLLALAGAARAQASGRPKAF
ncbi:MAG: hypothetical protein RJA44_2459 [Pseudomonadota bacterium]